MGREILFCGKRLDNGKWSVGSLVRAMSGDAYWIDSSYADGLPHIETISEKTIGQYTGLTDKNGVKIFEGDIVRVCLNPDVCVGEVEYDNRIAGFIIKFRGEKCVAFMDIYMGAEKTGGLVCIEVIGNIHDNPELLEASHE